MNQQNDLQFPPQASVIPYATPRQFDEENIWAEGDKLVMRKDAILPQRCVKCNAEVSDGWSWKKTLYWQPGAYLLLILLNVVICLIVIMIVRKKIVVEATLCPTHRKERKSAMLVTILSVIFGIAAMIGGFALAADKNVGGPGLLLSLFGLGGIVFAVIYGNRKASVLQATKIQNDVGWLRGAGPEFLASLTQR